MSKSATLYARIEPEVKEEAENILKSLGISASSAINMFYKQIIIRRGLPFDVALPQDHPLNIANMTREQLEDELDKGYQDYLEGRTRPAEDVFKDIRREYGL